MATTYEFKEIWLDRPEKAQIYTKQWIPFNQPVLCTVIFFHGLGEHINRYEHLFAGMAKAGMMIGAFDQRGFGRTAKRYGKQGVTDGLEYTMQDALAVTNMIKIPGKKHFSMGHSMGGGLCIRFAVEFPELVDGVVACSPLIEGTYRPSSAGHEPNILQKAFKTIISQKLLHSARIPLVFDYNIISRDEYAVQVYREDPFIHTWVNFKLVDDMFSNGDDILNKFSADFKTPILITHGTDDELTSHDASEKFIEIIQSIDKQFVSIPEARHELHNELDKEQTIQSYIEWIKARV
ncbi:hypothetical protein HK103_001601 [Boothiomyces macroporosus]|uniref:Serine aminopeptidase S33 domain-containing protein n=1 Tax=Boothiomyces macroporosus TaxID=261099 RepID=A0AAD5UA80_9FUNG|nr:hypothetical protein HK103_001601 [Boothiomyces macroporosus]